MSHTETKERLTQAVAALGSDEGFQRNLSQVLAAKKDGAARRS